VKLHVQVIEVGGGVLKEAFVEEEDAFNLKHGDLAEIDGKVCKIWSTEGNGDSCKVFVHVQEIKQEIVLRLNK
jgi:hypothetical protein